MTAHSPGAASGPPGPRRLASPERESSLLDRLLRAGLSDWCVPAALAARKGDSGFAALRFDAAPGSAHRTRSFLRSTLTSWRLDRLVDDATTVVAELVANAVTHALGPHRAQYERCATAAGTAWLALVREKHAVVCAVADPSPAMPAMREPDPFAESGRGLHIVAELSQAWGHTRSEGGGGTGKTVWARLTGGQ